MPRTTMLNRALVTAAFLLVGSLVMGQTAGVKEEFTATAIASNNLGSGAGTVLFNVTRWSTDEERQRLADALVRKGPTALLDMLRDNRSTGTIRTPDSIGYDLRLAYQTPTEEGGRRIVLATDRPISFWEATNQPRTIEYPFTVIQMELDREGHGKGTLSIATKVRTRDRYIELEDFATSPVMLTSVTTNRHDE